MGTDVAETSKVRDRVTDPGHDADRFHGRLINVTADTLPELSYYSVCFSLCHFTCTSSSRRRSLRPHFIT